MMAILQKHTAAWILLAWIPTAAISEETESEIFAVNVKLPKKLKRPEDQSLRFYSYDGRKAWVSVNPISLGARSLLFHFPKAMRGRGVFSLNPTTASEWAWVEEVTIDGMKDAITLTLPDAVIRCVVSLPDGFVAKGGTYEGWDWTVVVFRWNDSAFAFDRFYRATVPLRLIEGKRHYPVWIPFARHGRYQLTLENDIGEVIFRKMVEFKRKDVSRYAEEKDAVQIEFAESDTYRGVVKLVARDFQSENEKPIVVFTREASAEEGDAE